MPGIQNLQLKAFSKFIFTFQTHAALIKSCCCFHCLQPNSLVFINFDPLDSEGAKPAPVCCVPSYALIIALSCYESYLTTATLNHNQQGSSSLTPDVAISR